MKKYKIGIFVDSYYPIIDGVIVGVNSIAKILDKYVDLTIFTAAPHSRPYDDSVHVYKVVRCKSRKVPLIKKLDYDWPRPKKDKDFKKILNESELDLVHIRSPFGVGKMGLKYAKKHKIPTVITLHSQYKQDFYKASRSKLITAILMRNIMKVFNACDECWSVSESSRAVFIDYGIKKDPITMENGTDMLPVEDVEKARNEINDTYGIEVSEKVLLYVGRLVKVKNIFFIADVLKELKDMGYKFKMIFVGDGADRIKLQEKLEKLGVQNSCIFAGLIKDRSQLAKFYVRADLFLFPSFYDTDGVVKKEAACQRTPIICTEGSIVAKSVVNDHNAYTAPDNAKDYADKIVSIFADEEKHISVCGNAHSELYITWEKTAQKTLDRYKELIEKNKTNQSPSES